ncbi:MAG: vanadium-dependent haloperoxidase [Flavitalea sp.]
MRKMLIILLLAHQLQYAQDKPAVPAYLNLQSPVFSISMVMMHDVVNPPAASRFYTYAMLGAYEIVSQHSGITPLSGLLKNYSSVRIDAGKKNYDYQIAAIYSVLEIGKRMLPSGFMLQETQDKYLLTLKKNKIQAAVIKASVTVSEVVAAAIVAYAKTDGYEKLSARLHYTALKGEGYWFPTPPAYMEAIEPNWKTIRPMLIDSCNQFPPDPPVAFNKDSASAFFALAKEVYDVSKKMTETQLTIASFWDCNPFVVSTAGHMMLGFKKISPGGHWMNIACIASKKANLDFDRSVLLGTMVSLTIMDAFISCWDEKYRSNRIRPETFINRHIDIRWQPLLQTPPFPEYTSGHSVVSTASAKILSYFLGNDFSYTDNSENMFEIPERHFNSFMEAANEAAISRLYGGIHYRDAIVDGQREGALIADNIIQKISDAGIKPFIQ